MKVHRILMIAVLLAMAGRTLADNLVVGTVTMKAGETKEVAIGLSNPTKNYVAFQFDLALPEGITIAKNDKNKLMASLDEDRKDDHTLNVSDLGNNTYRFLSFSMTNAAFYGTSGTLVNITLQASGSVVGGSKTATIKEQVFTATNSEQSKWSDKSFTIQIQEVVVPVITADNKTREYGEENPTLTYQTSADITGKPLLTTTATKTSPVGDYVIKVERGTVEGDYTAKNGTLTITKAPLTISGGTYTIKQGEALPTFKATYSGFKNGETETVLTKKPTLTTTATTTSVPGTYDVVVSGAEAQNYAITYQKGKLTITEPAAISVTAKSYTREYGEENPTFGFSASEALSGDPEITCEATATSPVGTYPIIIKKGSVTNEKVTFTNGTLTITKAPLTISGGTYTMKQGEALPTFKATYSGFKNNETEEVLTQKPTLTTTATSASVPGTYDVVVSGAEAQNYVITYQKGTLTITAASFTLTYMVDGEVYKTVSYDYGTTITPEEDPTKEGYTFSGWSEIPETMPAEDVTVTGSFTCNSYNLTYWVDDVEYETVEVEYGTYIYPEAFPTKEGYTFSGWNDLPETMPAHDVTVTGTFTINKYSLTYMVDGEEYKVYELEYGAAITPEADLTKEGYTFSGWSEIPETMPAEDVTVTGYFTINNYKLIYKVDDEEYKVYELEYGAAITPEDEPTQEGYTFSGWNEVPETMPAHDVTVTGTFIINKYTLTYQVDGAEYKTIEVAYGTAITPEAELTKEGYTFSGWSEIPETMPAKDVIVTGSFTINKYKLIYLLNGEEYKTYEIEYGASITPEAELSKDGYTFSGWSWIPTKMPAEDVTITGSLTANKHKLTYLVDGVEFKTFEVDYGSSITPEEEPTKEGYTFSGWGWIPKKMPDEDVTVVGTFTVNKYKLTYMIDNEVYKVVEYDYGATITPEGKPEGDYVTFVWKDVPETMPAKDVTIYADYETGIAEVLMAQGIKYIYAPNGKRIEKLQKGLNIVVMNDGSVRKVVLK